MDALKATGLAHAYGKATELLEQLHSGVIDVSPARTQNCFACDGCEWAAVCGRDPLLPGSAERDYSGEDRDAVWAKLLGGEEDAP